nr:leucine-rich repeat domain-containing protein [Clostridiales bacterium]
MKKKILALLLCVVMVIGILPVYAFAQDNEDEEEPLFEQHGSFILEIFSVDENGFVAGINGYTGDATELDIPSVIDGKKIECIEANAFSNCVSLQSVTVSSEIETVYDYAFSGCENLISVTFGQTTALYGDHIFDGCSSALALNGWYSSPAVQYAIQHNISYNAFDNFSDYFYYEILDDDTVKIIGMSQTVPEDLVIPFSIEGYAVTQIGDNACSGNSFIKTVTVRYGIKSIGNNAFANCSQLERVSLSRSVTQISNNAFLGCDSLSQFTVAANNPSYSAIDGNLYSADGKTLICVPASNATNEFHVSESVTAISEFAFLNSVADSFDVFIPASVRTISPDAFLNIDKITIYCELFSAAHRFAERYDIPYYLYEGDFYYRINDDDTIEIGRIVCTQPKDIVIPSEINGFPVKSLGSYVARFNDNVLSITVSEGISEIAQYCFTDAKCTHITLPSTLKSISEHSFSNTPCEEIVIPEGVEYIAKDAMSNNNYVKHIVLPSTLKTIADYAFFNCLYLETVEIPEGVTRIGDFAFDACYCIKEITLPKSITHLGEWLFANCWGLKKLIVKSKAPVLPESFCRNCINLSYVDLPDTVRYIQMYAFKDCPALKSIVIPQGVQYILYGAFRSTGLESVTIPSSVIRIESYAFGECKNLKSVKICEGFGVGDIGGIQGNAFADSNKLSSIIIPKSTNHLS